MRGKTPLPVLENCLTSKKKMIFYLLITQRRKSWQLKIKLKMFDNSLEQQL
jgi:hypothetical protein